MLLSLTEIPPQQPYHHPAPPHTIHTPQAHQKSPDISIINDLRLISLTPPIHEAIAVTTGQTCPPSSSTPPAQTYLSYSGEIPYPVLPPNKKLSRSTSQQTRGSATDDKPTTHTMGGTVQESQKEALANQEGMSQFEREDQSLP